MLNGKISTFAPNLTESVMKNPLIHHIVGGCGILMALLMAACQSNSPKDELTFYAVEAQENLKEPPLDSVDSDDAFAELHAQEERELDVKVNMEFVKSDNEQKTKVCKLINDQLIELLLKQSSDQAIEEALAQYIETAKKEFHSDNIANIYYDHLKGNAEHGMKDVINYRLVEDTFMGGAHPCRLTTILRFNTQTGEFIPLDDVFSTIHQHALQDTLLHKLMADNGVRTLQGLQKKGFLEMSDMFVSHNFALRDDSIEFYYNEYDIAPYAYGPTTICLSYDQVKDIVNEKYKK